MKPRVACLLAVLPWLTHPPAGQEPGGEAERTYRALVVPIRGEIDMTAVALVKGAMREARSRGIQRVVLDISTPGGALDATKEIEAILASLQRDDVHAVAYVSGDAFSAGAYIALACTETFMSPTSSIGAITPVGMTPVGVRQLGDDVRRKAISALRSDIRTLMQRRGKGSLAIIAEAMVDPDLRIVRVTYRARDGLEKTEVVEARRLRELVEQGARILDQKDFGPGPLTLSYADALELGISSGTYVSVQELLREEYRIPPEEVGVRAKTWSEEAVAWINGMKPFLFVIGFILLLIELKTPGFAVPGALGVLLLALAMFGSYLVGLADWTEILLFFLGLGLIGVEVFLLPGTIVFGLVGFLCVVFGLILSQQTFVLPSTSTQEQVLLHNLLNMLLVLVLTIAGSILMWKLTPRTPGLRRILQVPPDTRYTGASTRFAGRHVPGPPAALVNRTGVAATDLRPAGIMDLDGERIDVVTEGAFVRRGTPLRVIEVAGNRIVVEPVENGGDAESGETPIGLLVLLMVVGLALVVAEVFFVSFGVLSVLAAVSMVSAIFLAFTQHGQAAGIALLVVAAVGVPAAIAFALKALPRTWLGRRLILAGPDHDPTRAGQEPGLERFLHKRGVTISPLRPAGFARIEGERVDVITRGEMLAKGVPVKVVQVEGNRVVVALDRDPQPQEARPVG